MFLTKSPAQPAFNPVLVNDPVLLRAAQLSDHDAWIALRELSREHLTAWEEDWAPNELTLAAFKRRLRQYEKDMRRGGGLPLLIFRRGDRELLGGVTLSNIRYGSSRSALLGYWVGAPHVQRGYGAAAVLAMLRHAFSAIDLNRVVAACQPENIASQKLLERCGFRREGYARDYLKINGAWRDHHIYAITAAEFFKSGDGATDFRRTD